MRTPRFIAGAILLVIVLIVVALLPQATRRNLPPATPTQAPVTTVKCYGGSEKGTLLDDPDVQQILRDKYALQVDYTKLGSLDTVRLPTDQLKSQDIDCLWPSNSSAQIVFEQTHKTTDFETYHAETVLRSPIVVYSWKEPTDALLAAKIVTLRDGTFYIVDMPQLLDAIVKKTRWEDLKADRITGPITIHSTDPLKSNSGNMLYLLFVNILSGNDVATVDTARPVLPVLHTIYTNQGMQATSSEYAFDGFIGTGVGANKLLAGYESQILEFSALNPDAIAQYKDILRVLYPDPTVWSDHPILALTRTGRSFLDAMRDPDIQNLAWAKHGFRSGLVGIINKPDAFKNIVVPSQIYSAVALPNPDVITLVSTCLQTGICQ